MALKILVIEDNEQNRYMIRFLLEKNGYKVVEARNGYQVIELAGTEKPSLILLDIQLPGMNGYTVARELRLNPETARIPIVMVTSYAMAGNREKGLDSGGNGYIEKPIDPETFVADIARFLPKNKDEQED